MGPARRSETEQKSTRRPEGWQHDPEEDRRQLARLRIIDRRYLARRAELERLDHEIEGRLWHTCAEQQLGLWSDDDLVETDRGRLLGGDPGAG